MSDNLPIPYSFAGRAYTDAFYTMYPKHMMLDTPIIAHMGMSLIPGNKFVKYFDQCKLSGRRLQFG
jgi:hypothetical protein